MFRSKCYCILLTLLLILSSCTYGKFTIYDNGKLRPNHITNFQTMDGNLLVYYFMERHKEIRVDDETMLIPEAFPAHRNIWLNETDKKVTATIRIINENKIPYLLVFNQRTSVEYDRPVVWRENVLYNGRLPYQEHVIEVTMKKGETTLWFDLYRKGKVYCFTRDMKFKY